MDIFAEIALITVLATLLGMIAHALRQPTIVGYILAGLIVGPLGIMRLNNLDVLNSLAEIGIALLLFLVGLEIDMRELKHLGKPALITGLGQVVFTAVVGFFIVTALGFALVPAIYISVALTFSSTIIVLKILTEKGDTGSLYGKISIGFLLVQDFVAVLALIFLSGLEHGEFSPLQFGITLGKGMLLFVVTLFLGQRIFPKLLNRIGKSQELLFLFAVSWGLGVASFLASRMIGLSLEIGGFLAGLALANSMTHFQIASRLRPLRDFFLLFFFVVLGAKIGFSDIGVVMQPAVLLSLFVLLGNPLIVLMIMGVMGYRARTSFLVSLTVAQISEFSLIVAALGLKLGHINSQEVSLVTLVGIITIIISSYAIQNGDYLYSLFRKPLKIFELRKPFAEEVGPEIGYRDHVVVVGAHRMGRNILSALAKEKEKFIVVDFDPRIVEEVRSNRMKVLYGDISDIEIQERAGLAHARLVISTIPDMRDSRTLIEYMRRTNPHAKVIVTAQTEWEGKELYDEGVDYVLLPHFIGGRQLADIIGNDLFGSLADLRQHDLALLTKER